MTKHRCSNLLALLALIAIVLGACLTSETRPLPGAVAASAAAASEPQLEQAHRIAGYVTAAGTAGLAIWVTNLPGWLALAIVIGEAFSGGLPVLHALFAPVLMALFAAVAVLTSQDWQSPPKRVVCDWKAANHLGMLTPILVVMQIGLGAAFRHNDMGPISHILNALIVLAVVLVAGIFVLRQYPDHPSLRPAALALLITAGIQVLLGFTVYFVLLLSEQNSMGLIVTGVLHVANGALTLAASVVLAMQMRRNLIQSSEAD